mmetsp:Transcript_24604/g.37405  ORF Transcript_24604/g.37405 Transcript_24604/m.37405 type:complete len:121 (+) Transcript_24604:1187-1549(+)
MNLESTPAQAFRRKLQESTTLSGSTCQTPLGSYSQTCQSVSVSGPPNGDRICNMAALCQDDSSNSPVVWNLGSWFSDNDAPSLSTNENGCLDSGDSSWSRSYCEQTACTNPPYVPTGCAS